VAAAAAASQQAGFVVEDVLASKIFTALVDAAPSNAGCSAVGGDSGGGGSSLLSVLIEVVNTRNLPSICHALSQVFLCPSAHAASARIAGEITALQGVRLLSLLQTSNDDEGFKTALEGYLMATEQRVAERCVSDACTNELLIMMCMQAHVMIGEGRIGAAVHAISGEDRVIRTAAHAAARLTPPSRCSNAMDRI
jgi:hypothetical protein